MPDHTSDSVTLFQEELLEAPHIAHGFFSRKGGVSEGDYFSLNCGYGSDDKTEKVSSNRARVADALGVKPPHLISVYQIHSPKVVNVTSPWDRSSAPHADAMVTNVPGIALGILTADCGPILFSDPEARVIGAAHAGWKGAQGGVLESTVENMISLGAQRQNIRAVIGPCISQNAYQVGPEFRESFLNVSPTNEDYFVPSADPDRPDHWQFDLSGYNQSRLRNAGVEHVENLDFCTYEDPENFFSYRRTTHLGEKDYGRNISAITLVNDD